MVPWDGLGLRWWTLMGAVSLLFYFSLLIATSAAPEALVDEREADLTRLRQGYGGPPKLQRGRKVRPA
jgi:hypothetical protein